MSNIRIAPTKESLAIDAVGVVSKLKSYAEQEGITLSEMISIYNSVVNIEIAHNLWECADSQMRISNAIENRTDDDRC